MSLIKILVINLCWMSSSLHRVNLFLIYWLHFQLSSSRILCCAAQLTLDQKPIYSWAGPSVEVMHFQLFLCQYVMGSCPSLSLYSLLHLCFTHFYCNWLWSLIAYAKALAKHLLCPHSDLCDSDTPLCHDITARDSRSLIEHWVYLVVRFFGRHNNNLMQHITSLLQSEAARAKSAIALTLLPSSWRESELLLRLVSPLSHIQNPYFHNGLRSLNFNVMIYC